MLPIGKRLLIMDGGMGSELERAGFESDPMELNITHPEVVRAVHAAYVQAGAQIITANSFGLNRIKYRGKYPLKDVVLASIENARSAGKSVFLISGRRERCLHLSERLHLMRHTKRMPRLRA